MQTVDVSSAAGNDLIRAWVSDVLDEAGVRALHVKGVTVERWLYADGSRRQGDVDVLVSPADFGVAVEALLAAGAVEAFRGVNHRTTEDHAVAVVMDSPGLQGEIDVHRRMPGLAPDPSTAFEEFWRCREQDSFAARRCWVPDLPTRALVLLATVAREATGPATEDLRRLVEQADADDWDLVLHLARRVHALPTVRAGLSRLPEGEALIETLGLSEVAASAEWELRLQGADRTAVRLAELSAMDVRQRIRALAQWVAPAPGIIRMRDPRARDGRTALGLAYLRRWRDSAQRLRPSLAAYADARRSASRGRPVLVNAKWTSQPLTGTQRYAAELLRAVVAADPRQFEFVFPADGVVPTWLAPHTAYRRLRSRGLFFEQVALPWVARGRQLVSLSGPAPIFARQQVVALHDAAVFAHPQTFSRAFVLWYRLMYRALARSRATLVTVSPFSAHELAAALQVPATRFIVIPNGSDHVDRLAEADPGIGRSSGFVLCLGTRARHKNLSGPLAAMAGAGIPTVVVGAGTDGRVFAPDGDIEGLSGSVDPHEAAPQFLGRLTDGEILWLYRRADALLFPSRYEGFGLPVVEAQRAGCPVVASDAAAVPDTAGSGAVLVSPDDTHAMVEAVRRLRADAQARAALVEAGRHNAARFTWAQSAELLRTALGSSRLGSTPDSVSSPPAS